MLCGSLATRELVLTSMMYPYHERDSIHVNNIDWVGDLYKRNIYQHAGAKENIGVKVPSVLAVSLRNLYQFWKQFPEKLHIKMPKVLSLSIKGILRRYTNTPVRMHIKLPQVVEMYIRSYLQKLFSHPLDDIFVVHVPKIADLHKKNIVGKYIEDEYGKLNIQVPEIAEMSLRNVLQKYEHEGETIYLTLPQGIEITGTTKPYLRSPILSGFVAEDEVFHNVLEWSDTSITHTGYLLFRDTSPIGSDTTLEPIQELDRYTQEYVDWDLDEGTTYYYRVTPKSIYGGFFSNLLTLDVPLYLRAPINFIAGFQSLSLPVDGTGSIQSLTDVYSINTHFLGTNKIQIAHGEYVNQIFTTDPLYNLTKVESPYQIGGTSKLGQQLRNVDSRFLSLESLGISFTEYVGDVSLRNISSYHTTVEEPENITQGFAGITKTFIRSIFVILGAALENRQGNFTSSTLVQAASGYGTREMMLRNPEAMLLKEGEIHALVGEYVEDIGLRTGEYRYTALDRITEPDAGAFSNPAQVMNPTYKYVPINYATGSGTYLSEIVYGDVGYKYVNTQVESVDTSLLGLTGIQNPLVYCILGSNSYGLKCRLAGVESPYGAVSQWSSLTIPRNIRTSIEEDQEFTLFSGYMPPIGFPMSYDTYRIGDSVIPVFRRQVISGDMTRFTIYERMFKSKEVTSGYRSPNGVDIRFSLFVDED